MLLVSGGSANAASISEHHAHHHPGCNSAECDRRINAVYARLHKPKFHIGLFERCVFNRESGTGSHGPWTLSTIRWRFVGNGYEGAANWLHSTWVSMGGEKYAERAIEASPKEQTLIFRAHATEPGQWDETVPPCLQYRGMP